MKERNLKQGKKWWKNLENAKTKKEKIEKKRKEKIVKERKK